MIRSGRTICHSCESRNLFLAAAAIPGAVGSGFCRNDRKKLDHRVLKKVVF
ncbi:Uncharacterized protein dnm_003390 [Desulfonema magnum]|uniref:Uncharacterized protein n=1 Tax=Desulfonema magnum TaxID=45655 RepID=A0A975GKB6_9BACT|nr:Uncharacterized protein dnm_003390 [Desulfonema magnum]